MNSDSEKAIIWWKLQRTIILFCCQVVKINEWFLRYFYFVIPTQRRCTNPDWDHMVIVTPCCPRFQSYTIKNRQEIMLASWVQSCSRHAMFPKNTGIWNILNSVEITVPSSKELCNLFKGSHVGQDYCRFW